MLLPNSLARYYLYAESMIDEGGVPVQEPLKLYEAENIRRAAQACVVEIPAWMLPKIDGFSDDEGWVSISLGIDGKDVFLELCNIDFKDVANL